MLFAIEKDEYDLPVYEQLMDQYGKIFEDIKAGTIVSAYEVERHGIAEAVSKMAFGNRMGVKIEHNIAPEDLFAAGWGNVIAEVPADKVQNLSGCYTVIGEVTDTGAIEYQNMKIDLMDAQAAWEKPLEKVFPTSSGVEQTPVTDKLYKADQIYVCKHKVAKPTVFIPVFPGTNCEYDSARVFEKAGATVITKVLKNITAEDIRDSVEIFEKAIAQSQIIMFPGGFSAGDEPEGSAKFFATAFRNAPHERSRGEALK